MADAPARNYAIATILTLFVLAAPAGEATHRALYALEIDRSAGMVFEDDGAIVHAPGNPLDGVRNRVTPFGVQPGEGTLLLDARLATQAGYRQVLRGTDILTREAVGRDILVPGVLHASAWYGEWNDYDRDSYIADIHDAQDDPADEFKWRGAATEETVAIAIYLLPFGAPGTTRDSTRFHFDHLIDFTSLENDEQGWAGSYPFNSYDLGLLRSATTVTVAGARPEIGGVLGYDLTDPAALVDVDHYEALNGDVEALWLASLGNRDASSFVAEARDTIDDALGSWIEAVNDTLPAATEPVSELVALVQEIAREVQEAAAPVLAVAQHARREAEAAVADLLAGTPPTPPPPPMETPGINDGIRGYFSGAPGKEPNNADDDYEFRAFFGGVGDALGSHNTYPGYTEGYHFFFDNVAFTRTCVGVYAAVPGTGVAGTNQLYCFFADHDALGYGEGPRTTPTSPSDGPRQSSQLLVFEGRPFLWKDLNADGWPGTVCDPESEDFDVETNACRKRSFGFPSGSEVIHICESTTGKGGTFTVAPVGGTWDGAVLIRDAFAESTRVVYDPDQVRLLTSDDPVEIRWRPTCGSRPSLESRDAILFPMGGSRVPLRVESLIELPEYRDATFGIDITNERVFDVDIIAASL